MAGLGAKVSPLLTKSAGSVTAATAQIRAMKDFRGDAVAGAMDDLQDQINQIVQAATQSQSLLNLAVTSRLGALIGWVGTQIVSGVSYMGAWFREMRIGGTSAADAKIIADANGDVTITGASITLDLNGVTTVISNDHAPSDADVESLTSIDNASGDYSYINPFEFQSDHKISPGVYGSVATIGQDGSGHGFLRVQNAAHTARISAATLGAGFTNISLVDSSGDTATLTPSSGLQFGVLLVIDPAGNATLHNLAISGAFSGTHAQNVGVADSPTFAAVSASGFTASGNPGISPTDTRVVSVGSALASYLTSVSVSTSTISYTPGATTATFVDGIGSTSSNAVSAISSSSVSDGYTDGIRTS